MRCILSCFIVLTIIVLSGCAGAPATTTADPSSVVIPKVGSWFVMHTIEKFTTGEIRKEYRDTTTFVQRNLFVRGKKNVSLLRYSAGLHKDSLLFAYEPNGDLSFYSLSAPILGDPWMTMPFFSGKTHTQLFDTVIGTGEAAQGYKRSSSRSFIGTDTLSVLGKTYEARVVRFEDTVTITRKGTATTTPLPYSLYYFIPELGFMSRVYSPSQEQMGSTTPSRIRDSRLESFNLRK